MNPAEESLIRKNWEVLKREVDVDYFVERLSNSGQLSPTMRNIILNTGPQTQDMKAERFLETIIQRGGKCYQTMCNILLENRSNPKYQAIIRALELDVSPTTPDSGVSVQTALRQETILSETSTTSSLSLNLGATAGNLVGDKNERMISARALWRDDVQPKPEESERPSTPADAVQKAVKLASDEKNGNLDMETLEKELLKIAPTIADLFTKIQTQTLSVTAHSEEELKKIKDDNDRLRKTNRTLVEKLNTFQQKIIQLQLENKKLREISDNEKVKQNQLDEKSTELEKMKDKLIQQKRELEEKEKELDLQMSKLQNVIIDNEEQKLKMANLEQLHEEGLREYEEQQQQIQELQKEKDQQREQIEALEEKQKNSEQLLYRLEERLIMLEQRGQGRNRTRPRYMGSLGRGPWMNGMMEKSHHVNVKLQPQFPAEFDTRAKGRGWNM